MILILQLNGGKQEGHILIQVFKVIYDFYIGKKKKKKT